MLNDVMKVEPVTVSQISNLIDFIKVMLRKCHFGATVTFNCWSIIGYLNNQKQRVNQITRKIFSGGHGSDIFITDSSDCKKDINFINGKSYPNFWKRHLSVGKEEINYDL